jgi:1-acyl-sn-glycerol-3-phosphate acyltransferase
LSVTGVVWTNKPSQADGCGAERATIDSVMATFAPRWRPPHLWRLSMLLARILVATVARLRVTGDVPDGLRDGPLILAANHLSPFDPIALAAACCTRRVAPRYLATGGLFRAPVVGAAMRHWGHIPVHRGTDQVTRALPDTVAALAGGSVVLVYPEGRITLDPQLWPERGKTGVARLALATGVTVVPVSQWGTHEVVPYSAPRGLLRALPGTVWRRPVIRVHLGQPVELADLSERVAGHAQRATDRIIDAITAGLVPLRASEPGAPRHRDPSRPRDRRRSRPHPPGPPAAPPCGETVSG